ncbi:MAG: type VI secretion system membrane subunit TssM [Pseudomonadota bacterium]
MKLLGFFRNRWFIAALGLTGLSLFIWFLGPLFGFADSRPLEPAINRSFTILAIVVLWLITALIRQVRSQSASNAIAADLAEPAAPAPGSGAEENEAMRRRFEEAIATLKRTRGKRGRLNLYELPWYVIIGPPGTGKTTAIQNSGLRFPLKGNGQDAIQGVGGTRNCDWWFTDEAILLDTAGRYVTQDSDAGADRREWFTFLDQLKRHRKRRPINGVLLAISVADVMQLNASGRDAHVDALRQRIQELYERCGMRVPIYVMLTKCDLIAGFVEFFGDLSREQREQVWGTTFPLGESGDVNPLAGFDVEFDLLIDRLNAQVLDRIHQERDPMRRAAIYDFPAQVANVKPLLSSFLTAVFRGSSYETNALVRGVYLTSGTQEGSPIDRLMGNVSRNFGMNIQSLPAFHGEGRSYFVGRLLRDLVFQEAGLAGTNRKAERRLALLQSALYAGTALVVLAVFGAWAVSYFGNQQLIADTDVAVSSIDEQLEGLDGTADLMRDLVPTLTAIRMLPGGFADQQAEQGPPLTLGLGLYQGEKMGGQATIAYRRMLVEQLLPRLMLQLETRLRSSANEPDVAYESLKRYLMLDSVEHYAAAPIVSWFAVIARDLARSYSQPAADEFMTHVQALFERRPEPLPLPLDDALIAQVRAQLQRIPPAERAYGRLKYADTGDILGFSVAEAAGPDGRLVFVRRSGASLNERLPALYTPQGYQQVFLPQSLKIASTMLDESWVLGQDVPLDAGLAERVKERYFDDYVAVFDELLRDLTLAPFGEPRQATRILRSLTNTPSPLTQLIDGLNEATDLEAPALGIDVPGAGAGAAAAEASSELSGILSRSSAGRAAQRMLGSLGRIEERFGRLRRLSSSGDGQTPLAPLLELLRELYEFMTLVDSQQNQGGVPPHVARQGEATIRAIQSEADGQIGILRSVLSSAAEQSSGIAFGGISAYLDNEWNGRPARFCRDAIAGRYPIARNSTQSIRLQDFAVFFGPNGIMDQFFNDYLKPYVDTSSRPWRLRDAGKGFSLSSSTMRQFERASAIREVFFTTGATPEVQFDLVPLSMDTSLSQFQLSLDGQRISYSFGPKLSESLKWPGPEGSGEVRVQMTPPGPSGRTMVRQRGPWAWFRVLQDAGIRPTGRPETYRVDFNIDNRRVSYELIARSAFNPFQMDALSQFVCPTKM